MITESQRFILIRIRDAVPWLDFESFTEDEIETVDGLLRAGLIQRYPEQGSYGITKTGNKALREAAPDSKRNPSNGPGRVGELRRRLRHELKLAGPDGMTVAWAAAELRVGQRSVYRAMSSLDVFQVHAVYYLEEFRKSVTLRLARLERQREAS